MAGQRGPSGGFGRGRGWLELGAARGMACMALLGAERSLRSASWQIGGAWPAWQIGASGEPAGRSPRHLAFDRARHVRMT
eukprot:scaffold62696_cov47-Phaeocystis_antarctica.AAC.1